MNYDSACFVVPLGRIAFLPPPDFVFSRAEKTLFRLSRSDCFFGVDPIPVSKLKKILFSILTYKKTLLIELMLLCGFLTVIRVY